MFKVTYKNNLLFLFLFFYFFFPLHCFPYIFLQKVLPCIVCYPVKGFIMSDTRNCKLQHLEGSQKSGVWGFSIGYIYSVCWFISKISKLTGNK